MKKRRHQWKLQQCVPSAAACQPLLGPWDLSKGLAHYGDVSCLSSARPEAQLSLLLLKEHLPSYYIA